MQPHRMVAASQRVPMSRISSLISGNHIRIQGTSQLYSFFIGPFIKKYLDCRACVSCGLPIQFAQVMQVEKNSKAKLYFFSTRRGKVIQFTKDHCIPLAHGGPNEEYNIQPMCADCNTFKGDSLTMNPRFWILRKKIEFEATIKRYHELFADQQIDEETYGRRMIKVSSSYNNMRQLASTLFNIEV